MMMKMKTKTKSMESKMRKKLDNNNNNNRKRRYYLLNRDSHRIMMMMMREKLVKYQLMLLITILSASFIFVQLVNSSQVDISSSSSSLIDNHELKQDNKNLNEKESRRSMKTSSSLIEQDKSALNLKLSNEFEPTKYKNILEAIQAHPRIQKVSGKK